MNTIRYIIFIPIIFLVIAVAHILLPMALLGLMNLSKIWLIILLLFFSGLIIAIFKLLPSGIAWLSAKISPSETFAFYTIFVLSILIGAVQIYGYWTAPDITASGIGRFIGILLTCLTIGFTSSFSLGAGIQMLEEKNALMISAFAVGTSIFYIGMFLVFCLLSTKICYINPNKSYIWFHGIWHGIFAIPNWIVSWFSNGIYCKAPNSTTAYSIWWWISFIFWGLSIFSGGSRR